MALFWWRSKAKRMPKVSRGGQRLCPFRPRVEQLEDRWLPSITATEGVPFTQTVAEFEVGFLTTITDVTIDWGDGTPTSEGTVTFPNDFQLAEIQGAHTYPEGGTYTLTITAKAESDGGP